jgi:hypothetical protein
MIETRGGGYLCSMSMFVKNVNKMQREKAEQAEKLI